MWALTIAASCLSATCSGPVVPQDAGAPIEATYSKDTGRLTQLRTDTNRNGRLDTVSYMDGTRVERLEFDADEDGSVDRWEHYDAAGRLLRVGFSRGRNGREDAWSYADTSGAIIRIEFAAAGDGRVTRTEYYHQAALVSAEEDSDGDGVVDRWERYEDGRLATLTFDATGSGRATTTLTYALDGSVHIQSVQGH